MVSSHNIIILIFILLSLKITTELCAQELVLSDTITVKLERRVGNGPFPHASTLINPATTDSTDRSYGLTELYKNLPEGLDDHIFSIGVWNSDVLQSAWSRLKTGLIDSTRFQSAWYNDLTEEELARFVDEFVDTQVSLLYAEKGDEHIFIVDTDNDEEFIDEVAQYLKRPKPGLESLTYNSPITAAAVERVIDGKVVQDSAYLALNPFKGLVTIGVRSHSYTTLNLDGETKHIYLSNRGAGIRFDKNTLRVMALSDPFSEEDTATMAMNPVLQLELGERITTAYGSYRIVGVSENGLELKLLREDENAPWYGTQIGATAPMIEGETIYGEPFESEEGKFRILDFWATWCAPCLEEIPYLLDVNEFFKDYNFEVVSIADDTKERVEKFVGGRKITWPQLIASDTDEVLSDYNVTGYPKYFLLDDKNKVVMRNYLLRGYGLVYEAQKAMQISDKEMAKQVRKGNLLVRVANHQYSKVKFSSEFTPKGAKPMYNRHNPEHNWERGFDVEAGVYKTQIVYEVRGEFSTHYKELEIHVTGEAGQVVELDFSKNN